MFSTSYAPTEKLSIFSSLGYSMAHNRNTYSQWAVDEGLSILSLVNRGLTIGSHADWYDAELGLKWEPKKDLTIEPHYAYYGYRVKDSVETGNYSAHIVWLDVSKKW